MYGKGYDPHTSGAEFDLAWVGWGKLNRKCQVSNRFFGGAPTAINTCLDEEKIQHQKKSLQKKRSSKVRVLKYQLFLYIVYSYFN